MKNKQNRFIKSVCIIFLLSVIIFKLLLPKVMHTDRFTAIKTAFWVIGEALYTDLDAALGNAVKCVLGLTDEDKNEIQEVDGIDYKIR